MTALPAALLCAAAVFLAFPVLPASRRLAVVAPPRNRGRHPPPAAGATATAPTASGATVAGRSGADGPAGGASAAKGAWMAAAVTAVAGAVLVGGVAGVVTGVVAGAVCQRFLVRLEPRAVRTERQRLAADLPAAADLLAACLLSGAPMVDAAEAVATALGGPVSGPLREVAAAIRLGADPPEAWRALDARAELAPLSRAVARAMAGGAPLADALTRLADDRRRSLRAEAAAAAHRVGVRAAAPLGLCFLPAFVLIGVTPVVASIATTVVIP